MIQQVMMTFLLFLVLSSAHAFQRYGERYCHDPAYRCVTIKRGDSWAQLFPDPVARDIVKRVNRMNVFLQPDMIIAVPVNLKNLKANDLSPFAHRISERGEKRIVVDLTLFAFAAYNEEGQLLKWGPISPGAAQCLNMSDGCRTPTGAYHVLRKMGADCESNSFPRRLNGVNGGGEMPWCVFFYKGYALHGSTDLPGYAASYGCVRLFDEDAEWLNRQFVDLPSGGRPGTSVVVRDY